MARTTLYAHFRNTHDLLLSDRVLAAALMELSHRWIDRDPRPDSQAIEVCFHEMAWRGLAAER